MKARNYHVAPAFVNLLSGVETTVLDTTAESAMVTDSGSPTVIDACVELLGGVLIASVTVTLERLDNLSQNWNPVESRTVSIGVGIQRSVAMHSFVFETQRAEGLPGETCVRLRVQSSQPIQVLGGGLSCLRAFNVESQ